MSQEEIKINDSSVANVGVGQQQQSLFQKPVLNSVARLKNLMTINIEEIAQDTSDIIMMNTKLVADNSKLVVQLKDLESRHNKLIADYNKTLELVNEGKLNTVTTVAQPTNVVIFDSAIHQYKPSRPLTLADRDLILSAYQNLYKQEGGVKTLPEFFRYVNDAINPTASKTEIEGVIYNRFDERLYK